MTDLTLLYTPHEWKTQRIQIACEEWTRLVSITTDAGLTSCGGNSGLSHSIFERTGSISGLFFYDVEQIFMGLGETTYGQMLLGTLAKPWREYAAGSLVFAVSDIDDQHFITVGVAKE